MDTSDDLPSEWGEPPAEDDFIDCALNILKHLHRHVKEREEFKVFIPEVRSLIDSHRNMPGSWAES